MVAGRAADAGKVTDAPWCNPSHPLSIPREGLSSSPRSLLRRRVLVAAGIVTLAVGTVGIFVPLLPTTPFLLLAAACFFRSSPRLYAWLIRHRWLGSYLRNYREHRGMTRRAKAVALVLLWSVIGYSALRVATSGWLRLFLGAVAVGVTLHLLHLKTMTRNPMQDSAASGLGSVDAPAVQGRDDLQKSPS